MHLDNLNKGQERKDHTKKPQWDKPDKSKVTCYNCGKPGHYARDCRSKNKVTRQLNVLTQPSDNEEEWTVVDGSTITREKKGQTLVGWRTETTETSEEQASDNDDWEKALHPIEAQGIKAHLWNETMETLMDNQEETQRLQHHQPKDQDSTDTESRLLQKDQVLTDTDSTHSWMKEHDSNINRFQRMGLLPPQTKQNLRDWYYQTDDADPTHMERCYQSLQQYYKLQTQDAKERLQRIFPSTKTRYSPRRDRTTTRSPHPGNRVHGIWDQDEATEASVTGKERELTPEELDIHSPPASPKLQRQNATLAEPWNDAQYLQNMCAQENKKKPCYANDEQALVINDTLQEDWVSQANTEFNTTQTPYRIPLTDRYLRDPRNPKHDLLSWTACNDDDCQVHYSDKHGRYFPQRKGCKYQWYDCPKDTCATHLYDKRITGHFPNTKEEESMSSRLLVNGSCMNYTWQFCLQPTCNKHRKDKEDNGYGQNESFLGTTADSGIIPRAATRQTPQDSSNSQ
jgi:hypothetical protein